MTIDRRQFVKLTVVLTSAAMTGVAGALAAACSSDDSTPGPTPGGTFACRASISQNHLHAIVIPVADLDSSTAKTYSIRGMSDHGHDVKLEPSDFAELKAGLSVNKTSDFGGQTHDHKVAILCATI